MKSRGQEGLRLVLAKCSGSFGQFWGGRPKKRAPQNTWGEGGRAALGLSLGGRSNRMDSTRCHVRNTGGKLWSARRTE